MKQTHLNDADDHADGRILQFIQFGRHGCLLAVCSLSGNNNGKAATAHATRAQKANAVVLPRLQGNLGQEARAVLIGWLVRRSKIKG